MGDQLDLVGESIGQAGDGLQRFYTPQALASQLVGGLGFYTPSVVIEPSVGGGAFARAARQTWPNAKIIGVDVDPNAEGLGLVDEAHVGDWAAVAAQLDVPRSHTLVLGNPPFKTKTRAQRQQLVAHIQAAIAVSSGVFLVLPWAHLTVVALGAVMRDCPPSRIHTIQPRPWGEVVRDVALYQWTTLSSGEPTIEHGTIITHLPRWKP